MTRLLHERFETSGCWLARLARPCTAICTSLILLGGCRDAPRTTHPVTGSVQIRGQAAAHADLVFYDVSGRAPGGVRPYATTDEAGRFTVSTYGMNDGAPAGEYEITVSWKGPLRGITPDQRDSLPERLPPRYLDPATSGIRMRVVRGENTLQPIELMVP
jgi:hypothetical protein